MDALYKYFLLTFAVQYGLELKQLSCLFQELAFSELDVQGSVPAGITALC
jgi:hypothetical protein